MPSNTAAFITHDQADAAQPRVMVGPGSDFMAASRCPSRWERMVAGASGSKLGVRLVRGTEGSNPAPSSGESTANLTSSIRRLTSSEAAANRVVAKAADAASRMLGLRELFPEDRCEGLLPDAMPEPR